MAKGMSRSLVIHTNRLKRMAGEVLLQASLRYRTPFILDVMKAGGRLVEREPLPLRKA